MEVNAIIFDLGGVLLNIDYEKTIRSFNEIGNGENAFSKNYTKAAQVPIFDLFEEGKATEEEFRYEIRNLLEANVSDQEIDNAWNSLILDFPSGRIEWLEELSKSVPLFLLSNTNSIHVKCFSEVLEKAFGYHRFLSVFKKVYYSNEIGIRKPKSAAFQLILNEYNLAPENTLFIDDSIQHINTANELKINTLHLKTNEEVEIEVKKILK